MADYPQSEIKLVIVGLGGVGKSALTIAYVSNVWVPEYDPTVEDTHRKMVEIDEEAHMLDILDTAGQEEFSTMHDQWFMTGQGFLLVYSIISRKSFEQLPHLKQKILRIKDSERVPMMLVGNKSDLEESREVSKTEGETMAEQFGCVFMETSAKKHLMVNEAFEGLVREVKKHRAEEPAEPAKDSKGKSGGGKKKSGFCVLL
eukprot:TRINITY_DN15039_c0_g1_i1.p2 TRINITY_DN15039_c0_g1~~TRINITY_DN15039_c0_g1_i1.p2  ORF type:complete len:202 (+),score=26.58 TRINITY_DN15039_c0_g1_i1:535-1140(+)